MQPFKTVLCVDGSASKQNKRPVYCVRQERNPAITRFRHSDGVLAALDKTLESDLPRPLLITADVPIGLPAAFPEVWREFGGFLLWLDARGHADWGSIVVDSVAKQTARTPFVVCKKGEKKLGGKFPLRKCDVITDAESMYWCIGGRQVGKAALQFWRDTLIRLRSELRDEIAVWPFEPISGKAVVVAECYPAILYPTVWQRRVTKTSPLDVVDALYGRREISPTLCDERTWLHAASSEDEFDIFTTAVAIAEKKGDAEILLTAPEYAKPVEGWMLLLPEPLVGRCNGAL
jgi:hypothetical protein